MGGRVLARVTGEISATVPRSALAALAGSAGVTEVAPAVEAVPDVVSQGVSKSGASTWINATPATTGAGVTVAVVDVGFGNLSAEVAAGALPAGTTVTSMNNTCPNVNGTEHGTAVAEIVHQMAPSAKLQLYCIADTTGFRQAEQDIVSRGIPIVNSSLSFPGDSRGDGTGDATSAAATVQAARKAGVLWVASAGNTAQDHWSGTFGDGDRDGFTDLNGTTAANEQDAVVVPPGQSGIAYLTWDQWPQSSAPVTLVATPYKCDPSGCQSSTLVKIACPVPNSCSVAQPTGSRPVLSLNLPDNTTSNNFEWVIQVKQGSGTPGVRYDLSYYGDVGPSLLWGKSATRAAAGSVDTPASSPYALAVGAANVANNSLEAYSSRGPTIDRRVKPDITGFDNVASNLDQFSSFSGTSAGAPHVAGAAALIKSANSNLDAAQLQAQLESRATGIAAGAPPTNQLGHGLLALGAVPPVSAPAGNGYLPLSTPSRVFDSRIKTSSRPSGLPLATGEQVTVTLTGAPSGASAVALNLAGTGATGSTYLTVFPSIDPGTSTLNLSTVDPTAAVFTIVGVGPSNTIKLRNAGASTHAFVDVLGYFTPSGTLGYTATVPPTRILDTRQNSGPRVVAGATVTVTAPSSVPTSAKALAVNVTATNETGSGYLSLSPDGSKTTSTLNYSLATRANSNIVTMNSSRQFKIYNNGSATHIIVDLVGYLATSTTGRFVPLTPVRIVDTRYGNGGRFAPLGAAATMTVTGSGIFDVPYPAAALMVGVVPVPSASTPDDFLTIYPSGARPNTSSVNFSGGRLVPNGVIMTLATAPSNGPETSQVYNAAGSVDIVLDLLGYFLK
jgi:subtilisin family serine protease